jgi:hypothetical protein
MAQKLQFPSDSPMSDFLDVRLCGPTRDQYIVGLKMFFDSLGLEGSIDNQSREFLTRARKDKEWAQNGLKYFIRDKKQRVDNRELAEGTIRNFYKPVKLFCVVHDIELAWKKIAMMLPKGRKFANDRAPTREEVQTVIEYPDRRIKPLVLVTCSSGIRIGAWEYLKWKHVEPIKRDDKIVAAKIIVYAGENEQYFSFITPEAFQALQEWMDYRKKCGEEITGESYLMRTLWDTTGPTFSTSAASPNKMTTGAIKAFVMRALRSQGLRSGATLVAHRHEFKTSHGFRKFFQTNCEPKLKSLDVMTLMGQDTGLAASYNKPTVDMLLTEYLKAVDHLTINKDSKQQTEIIRNQQVLAVEIQAKDREIHELKEQMAQSKQEIKDRFQAYESKMAEFVHDIQVRLNTEERSSSTKKLVMDKMTEILDRVAPSWFQEIYGPKANRLTPKGLEKVKESIKIVTSIADAENHQRDLELQKQKKVLMDSMDGS